MVPQDSRNVFDHLKWITSLRGYIHALIDGSFFGSFFGSFLGSLLGCSFASLLSSLLRKFFYWFFTSCCHSHKVVGRPDTMQ